MEVESSGGLLTGASAGIGEATARAAAAHSARVVLAARRADRVVRITDESGGRPGHGCDVTDADQVAALVTRTLQRFGRIDAVVDDARQGLHARVEETAPEDFRALLELDLVAPWS